MDRC